MKTMEDNGGAAFPRERTDDQRGMSLRDYFAGQALTGMLADNTINPSVKEAAEHCYATADAMLAEREKQDD